MKNLSNTEAEFKKSVVYKRKSVVEIPSEEKPTSTGNSDNLSSDEVNLK